MDLTFFFFLIFFFLPKVVNNAHWERYTDKACTNKTNIQKPSFWKWRRGQHLLFKAQAWSNSGMAYYTTSLPYVNANIFHNCLQHFHFWGLSFERNQCVSSSTQALACSSRSDSGKRYEVTKEMKTRGGTLPLPFIFSCSFLLRTTSRYLNAWNRLPRHSLTTFLCVRVCEVSIDIHWRVKIYWGVESFELPLNPFQETQRCRPLNKAKFPLNIIS